MVAQGKANSPVTLTFEDGTVDLRANNQEVGDAAEALPAETFEHPRILRANRCRDDVRAYTDPQQRGVMAIDKGLAGRLEVTIEVDPMHRGQGLGRLLASADRRLAGDEAIFVQVSPGNSASLRAFAAAGYRPIGGEVLFLTRNNERPDEPTTQLDQGPGHA